MLSKYCLSIIIRRLAKNQNLSSTVANLQSIEKSKKKKSTKSKLFRKRDDEKKKYSNDVIDLSKKNDKIEKGREKRETRNDQLHRPLRPI